MNLLFDVSPEEVPDKRRPSKRRKAAEEPATAATIASARVQNASAHVAVIGTLDGVYHCVDERCQAMALDILGDTARGELVVECAFCGTGQIVKRVGGAKAAQKSEFRFRGGRFDGKTLDEAAGSSRGEDYIRWAAREHPRQAVRQECETWLAAHGATR